MLDAIVNSESHNVTDDAVLDHMTMLNVTGEYGIVWTVFFFTVIYSVMGHILLYFFEEKRK